LSVPTIHDQVGWKAAATPLTPDQVAEATQVGQRLVEEFRPLFDRLPQHAHSGLGLARYLGIDRGTSTRFVGVFAKPMDGLGVLEQFPGVRGLRQILEAMSKKNGARGTLAAATAAVDRFERLIHDLGGSQTKLAERIAALRSSTLPDSPEAHERALLERRRQLFEASSAALGSRMDLWTVCQVYRPTPGSATQMDQAMLRGTFGYRARRDAPAYALRSFGRNDGPVPDSKESPPGERAYQALEGTEVEGVPQATVFREFSSDPPPLVTNRGQGREAVALIDAERSSEERGLDLAVAHVLLGNWRVPMLDTPPTHDVSVYVGTPCARMVFDVFLHRSMARQCVPSMNLYRTTPAIFSDPSAHWYDKLPYPPALQIYLPDPRSLASRLHGRHPELLGAFFARLGWPMEEFVGYRVEVEYPYWCGFYSMMFDYRAGGD
jgi:hypothetical protein